MNKLDAIAVFVTQHNTELPERRPAITEELQKALRGQVFQQCLLECLHNWETSIYKQNNIWKKVSPFP